MISNLQKSHKNSAKSSYKRLPRFTSGLHFFPICLPLSLSIRIHMHISPNHLKIETPYSFNTKYSKTVFSNNKKFSYITAVLLSNITKCSICIPLFFESIVHIEIPSIFPIMYFLATFPRFHIQSSIKSCLHFFRCL